MKPMEGIDAKFLYSETPTAHMHTIKVAVSDVSQLPKGFSIDVFVDVLARHLGRLPQFRRRAVPVPLSLGHPVWIEDPDFDLRNHVSHRQAAPPGTDHELAKEVAAFAAVPLRRDRPLWEIVVVDGLANGRMAAIAKIHHALADGTAAVALLQNVVRGVNEVDDPGSDDWRPEPVPTRGELARDALSRHGRRLRGLPELVRRSARGTRASEARRRAATVRPPLPLQTPRTSLNVSLTAARTFAMTSLSLDAMKSVRRAHGTTLNDVYLAVCAGALRRYLTGRRELPARSLVASVPVSTDPNDTRLSGNRVDNLYVTIGTDIDNPLVRLQHCHEVMRTAKHVREVLGNELFEQRAEVVPPQLYRAAVRAWSMTHLANHMRPPINLVISNVAGPRERILFGPIGLEALYSVGPILEGVGLNLTAWSYVDRLYVSALGCPVSLPDPWSLVEALHGSLEDLVACSQRPASDDLSAASGTEVKQRMAGIPETGDPA
jgi:WS/DGAT/MGAT family acyltransferase